MSTSTDLVSCLKISLPYAAFCFSVHILSYAIFNGRLKSFAKKDKTAFYNRTVSTIHAIVMFSLSLYYWLFLNPTMQIGEYVDEYQAKCVLVMLGYLVYDTVFELSASKQVMTLGHHILGGASHISVLYSYNGACGFYSMIIFLAEASTPLLNASWLFQKLGMLKTTLFKLCALLLILAFFVFRVILSPYMLWHMWTYRAQWGENRDQLFWFNFLIVGSFGLLNYYWFYKLVQLALKK